MQLRDWLKESDITMDQFGKKIGRRQSIVSRICNRVHLPSPSTAVRIVVVTKGRVSLDDLYQTPKKFRADSNEYYGP